VNALSHELDLEIGVMALPVQTCAERKGEPTSKLKKAGDLRNADESPFRPYKEIFTATEYNYDTLATSARELAFLNKGLSSRPTSATPFSDWRTEAR
jgi:DNA gyrase subunit B